MVIYGTFSRRSKNAVIFKIESLGVLALLETGKLLLKDIQFVVERTIFAYTKNKIKVKAKIISDQQIEIKTSDKNTLVYSIVYNTLGSMISSSQPKKSVIHAKKVLKDLKKTLGMR